MPKKFGQLAVGIALAVLFIYLFLRDADLAVLGSALLSADPWLFTLAVVIAMSGFWARAVRWCCYLLPAKRVGAGTSFEIMMLGYMTSNFLPGRVGDFVVRPALMRRTEEIGILTTLATIAVERLFDLIVVLLFFASYVALFAPPDLGGLDLVQLRTVGWAMLGACALAVCGLVAMRTHEATALRVVDRAIGPLPERFRLRIAHHARSFASGLNLFQDVGNAARSIGYSLYAWVTVAIGMWLVTRSVGLEMVRPIDSLLLVGMGAVGVAIPTPGGVGSFHVLIAQGLIAIGAGPDDVVRATAILIWAMTWVPVNVVGLVVLARLARRGIRLRQLEAETTGGAEP